MSDRREFVLLTHDLDPTATIHLDDLPGSGRADLVARTVTASMLLSHAVRTDVRVHICVAGPYTVTFDGSSIRHLHPDERSTAALVGKALRAHTDVIGAQPTPVSPGLSIRRGGLQEVLSALPATATPLRLSRDGRPLKSISVPEHPVCVLSDHRPFTDTELTTLRPHSAPVSVGPRILHGADAVTVVHNYLDTAGYSEY